MGFSCFICSESFEATVQAPENGDGDGHKATPTRYVSAIGKCGHLFHSDCLKKALEAQSGNAWAPKRCPVCHITINLRDIIRVFANNYDVRSNQRPRLEEVMMAHGKLQDEYDTLLQRLEMMRSQMREMNSEIETTKRQKEELGLRFEQLGRLNSIHKADLDRYKAEIEKLKNIIITLTEKLTGNDCNIHDIYGPNAGNGVPVNNYHCRLEYTEELQRMPMSICDLPSMPQNVISGSLPKPSLHHPPGFMYPISITTENGSDCQDSDMGSQILSVSPEIHKASENSAPGTTSGSGISSENQQLRNSLFSVQNFREYDSNNNNAALMQSQKTEEAPMKNGNNFISKNDLSPVVNKAYSTAAATGIFGVEKTNNASDEKPKNTEKIEDNYSLDDENSKEKWHEKKNRRRTSSKGSRGDKHNNGKYDSLSDKKLLYGSFLCRTCKAKWGSSQSILNTPQICRYCKTEVYPYSQGPILSRKQLELNKQSSNNQPEVAVIDKKTKK